MINFAVAFSMSTECVNTCNLSDCDETIFTLYITARPLSKLPYRTCEEARVSLSDFLISSRKLRWSWCAEHHLSKLAICIWEYYTCFKHSPHMRISTNGANTSRKHWTPVSVGILIVVLIRCGLFLQMGMRNDLNVIFCLLFGPQL